MFARALINMINYYDMTNAVHAFNSASAVCVWGGGSFHSDLKSSQRCQTDVSPGTAAKGRRGMNKLLEVVF